MNRIKMMILSVFLFAVVGGALAFKVRFTNNYCVTATTGSSCPSGLLCPTKPNSFAPIVFGTTKYCTVAYDNNNCNSGSGIACGSANPTFLADDN